MSGIIKKIIHYEPCSYLLFVYRLLSGCCITPTKRIKNPAFKLPPANEVVRSKGIPAMIFNGLYFQALNARV